MALLLQSSRFLAFSVQKTKKSQKTEKIGSSRQKYAKKYEKMTKNRQKLLKNAKKVPI